MKLLAAAVVPLASFLVDAAVYRLRGHGSNHTQTEHHNANCDDFCQAAAMFGDICTYDFSSSGYDVTCSGCVQCQTTPAPAPPPIIGYKSAEYAPANGRLNLDYPETFVNAIKNSVSGPGYCELNLTEASWKNQHTCPQGNIRNVAYTITVEFNNHIGSTWHFDFGVDFGWGGVIYMNGNKQKSYAGDIWWAVNENHANHLGFHTFLPKGRHTMKVYGAEGCCDGQSRIKFCANCETATGADMQLLTIGNLETAVDHFMEFGTFSPQVGSNQYHAFTVAFETPPVVVVEGGNNSHIQVSQVSTTGFATKATAVTQSNLRYLAVEPGSHNLPDGRVIEAGEKIWQNPCQSLVFDFDHDYGSNAPAFEMTWLSSGMEVAPGPGVGSNLSPEGANLTAAQAWAAQACQPVPQPPVQPPPGPQTPAVEWSPEWSPHLSAVHRQVNKIGYVAMAKGFGQLKAHGDKTVNYTSSESLFAWTLNSFVI